MTVVRSIVAACGDRAATSAYYREAFTKVASFVLEGIAQNTSGSVFEPEVMSHLSTTNTFYYCVLIVYMIP